MRERIRKWLGLDTLATKADLVALQDHIALLAYRPDDRKPYPKHQTVQPEAVTFEAMQRQAIQEQEENHGED